MGFRAAFRLMTEAEERVFRARTARRGRSGEREKQRTGLKTRHLRSAVRMGFWEAFRLKAEVKREFSAQEPRGGEEVGREKSKERV